jgi:hypothetical protein
MKRILLLVVVVALLACAVFVFLGRRGASEGAQLVPADTVFYATLPDVKRTIDRWPKTALAQIGAEPAVADFFAKPAGQLAMGGGLEAADLLMRVKPGRLFLAVTKVNAAGGEAVLGFQFFGGSKDLDEAMDRLYQEFGRHFPKATRTTTDYHGDVITTYSAAAPVFYSAAHGSWGFLANTEAALQQALDRATGRDHSPALAESADFKTVLAHIPHDPDFLWFGRTAPVFDMLLQAGNRQQAAVDPKQLEQARKLQAAGGTLVFSGENQKEVSFLLYPDAPKLPELVHSTMALTTPGTTIFYESGMDWKTLASDEYRDSLPQSMRDALAQTGVDLAQLPQIFGGEVGVIASWPSGAMIPSLLVAADVKDRARAETLLNSVLTSVGVQPATSESHGARVFAFPTMKLQLVDPVLAVSDKFLLGSLTSADLERALTVQPGAPTLASAPAFKPALDAYKAGGQAFGYVDSKQLFERVYNTLRPIAFFAGTMSADVGKFIDVQKLPETDTISRHLSPIIYTNKQVPEGWVIESSGPVTLSQAFVLGAAGAGAAYASQMGH